MTDASQQFDLQSIRISPLDESCPIDHFRCGTAEIDDWARKKALNLHSVNRVKVFVAQRIGESSALGFYCLSFETKDTKRLSHGSLKQFPNLAVVYITYIAVLRSLHRHGLGSVLLIDALRRAYGVSQHVGFYGVALRSLNDGTTRLYERYGFGIVDDNTNPLMLLPIQSLSELFSQQPANVSFLQ